MIIHGNKQISGIIYSRQASDGGGAVALTNIIRGPQVVFGGLEPSGRDWLWYATKAAILAAFGQTDGKAVINATNAYLNQLAASDRDKATALAGYINTYEAEDPHMIYSIVPTLGVDRWLVGNGQAYIDTGIQTKNVKVEIDAKFNILQSSANAIVGCYSGPNWFGAYDGKWSIYTASFNKANNTRGKFIVSFNESEIVATDEVGATITRSGTRTSGNWILFGQPTDTNYASASYVHAIFRDHSTNSKIRDYIPFIRNNVNGMLDLISGTFYANAGSGSFTISETPSTP